MQMIVQENDGIDPERAHGQISCAIKFR